MTERYEVTHVPHYIGQRLVQPGEIVTLPAGVKPGRWLKLVGATAPAKAESEAALFAVKHNGAGNWVVERIADGSRASVVFKKAEGDAKERAEAEAARLNAGGEVNLGGTEAESSSDPVGPAAGTQGEAGTELPDA
ncbi:hypothetical protein D3C85_1376480 [compost metagenome]